MAEPLSLSESVRVAAPPEKVWDLVSDVTRMGEWSPETVRASWRPGSSGPAVGARFKGSNRRGLVRWTGPCEVTAAEPGREFAFVRVSRIDGGTDWRFTMEPDGDGTLLTETATQRREPAAPLQLVMRLMFGSDRQDQVRQSMRQTIERVKAAAEAG